MKQDMIAVLDLGSTKNTVLARAVRALGVYSEIHPHDITPEQLKALPNVKGVVNARLTALRTENGRLTAVAAADRTTGEETDYPCDGFFVAIGLIPENEAFRAWADLDANGYYDSGEDCRTKTEGVFTAGDARRKGVRQVATAAADGAVAALAACRYIADTAEKEGGM